MKAGSGTLHLTPWAAQALSLEEERGLSRRCVDLHCRMSAVGNGHGGWTLAVESWDRNGNDPAHLIRALGVIGHLADLMNGLLDRYARETRYTPEEILTIAHQSGVVQ